MSQRTVVIGLGLTFLLIAWAAARVTAKPAAGTLCEDIAKINLYETTITSAESITPPFTIKSAFGTATVSQAFCRVSGFLTPTEDSHIEFEVWMPATQAWNHKYHGVGNGGFSGALNYSGMVPGFNRGYATMTTNQGHNNPPTNPMEDVSWAQNHPEKLIDYAYRAEHLSALTAKEIIKRFYGVAPQHSYYAGCSAGGIQGITEVSRFPTDYDGYIIGDATPSHLGREIGGLWSVLKASLQDPPNAIQLSQLALVHGAVLKQCAGKDGGLATDEFLTDPTACHFDPSVLECKSGQDPSTCLTAGQVRAFASVYQGPRNPRTQQQISTGFTPGSEMTWDKFFVGKKNPVGAERPWAGFLTNVVYNDPDYLHSEKYLTFNFDSDYALVQNTILSGQTLESLFDNKNRNFDSFQANGGKIIHYHGWDDADDPALDGLDFFTSVVADRAQRHHISKEAALGQIQQFYRLFMVPGMDHCTGGAGPSNFGQQFDAAVKDDPEHDTLSALESWVEHGKAPDHFVASRIDKKTDIPAMTRPICPYPQIPVWKGSGSTNDANNFACVNKL